MRTSSGRGSQRAQRALHDPVVVPGARALVVLLVGDAEEDHRLDAEPCRAPRPRRRGRRRSGGRAAGRSRVRERLRPDEERHDEVVEVEPRLADEVAQRTRPAKPPQPRDGKCAHDRSLDRLLEARVRCQARDVCQGLSLAHVRSGQESRAVDLTQRRAAAGGGSASSTSTGTATGSSAFHGSSSTRSPKNSHDRAARGQQRQRDERTRQPVDLPAREQAEDDEQRVQAQRAPHHLRDHDVALHLVDREEQQQRPRSRRPGSTTSA